MKLMKTLIAGAVSMAFLPAVPAFAYEAGDIIVKAGVINVIPKDGNAEVGNSELDIDSDIQLGDAADELLFVDVPLFDGTTVSDVVFHSLNSFVSSRVVSPVC